MTVYHCSASDTLQDAEHGEVKGTTYFGSLGRGLYFWLEKADAFSHARKQRGTFREVAAIYEFSVPTENMLIADLSLWRRLTEDNDYPRNEFIPDQLKHFGVENDEGAVRDALVRADTFFRGEETFYGSTISNLIGNGAINPCPLDGIIARDYNKTGVYGVFYRCSELSGESFERIDLFH